MSCSYVSNKRILLSRNPFISFFIIAIPMLVIHAILYMNRNVMLNTEYMEYFCPAVIFLNGIATATDYMHYHIYADENGIDIYKWQKKSMYLGIKSHVA